jgi:predicted nuclease of restriction endonuclease-like RecB superfamily
MVGRTRDDIDAALDSIPIPARDRVAALGLRKVLEDRSEYEVTEDVDPEAIRREVFAAAAAAHRALDVHAELDRDAVLADVAARLNTTPAALESGLYADLRGSEILRRFTQIAPEPLLDRYNLSLAQSVLLRATRVTVRIEGETPQRYRNLFRAARFHGLIHTVEGTPDAGYTITLDGPFSLFDAVQRYGLRLAMFLPSILACASYDLRADVLWGRTRDPLLFTITPKDGLVSHILDPITSSPDLDTFCAAFRRLESEWTVEQNDRIFALPGEVVCVPDLIFTSSTTGEEVYLEAFGFWSRDAVWRRVELIRRGFPARILLAVGKQLRVSEEILTDADAGEIYVYGASMSPRALLDRLRRPTETKK